MSDLRQSLEDYLRIRDSLGYKTAESRRMLNQFVIFLRALGLETVTTEAAVAWAIKPTGARPGRWAARFSLARGFASYLRTIDPASEVPPAGLVVGKNRRATPYLYSEADITALLAAARTLRSPLRAATYETLLGLLAVSGLRVGEAIALDRDDVNPTSGLLTIREAKFGRTRQVPVHPTTRAALSGYAQLRDQLCPRCPSRAFFVSTTGTRLLYSTFHLVFSGLVRQAGLEPRSASCRPRPHDLRHSFAVTTLLGWYRDGVEIEPRLPLLSTYLGHVHPASTYWYLSGAPELFALVAERLETVLGQLP
jgi:integrase/recombinase XerD